MYTTFTAQELEQVKELAKQEGKPYAQVYARTWRRRRARPDMPHDELFTPDWTAERGVAFGRKHSLEEWASRFELGASTLAERVRTDGDLEGALLRHPDQRSGTGAARYLYNGEELSMAEIAAQLHVRHVSLRNAVMRYQQAHGGTVENALANIKTPTLRPLTANGKTQTLEEWADELTMPAEELCARMEKTRLEEIVFLRSDVDFQGVALPLEVWRYWLDDQKLSPGPHFEAMATRAANRRTDRLHLTAGWLDTLVRVFADMRTDEISDLQIAMEAMRDMLNRHLVD